MKKTFLNLLKQSVINSYLKKVYKKSKNNESFYNFSAMLDTKNYLISLLELVNPKMQYTDRRFYRASQSNTMKESFKKITKNYSKVDLISLNLLSIQARNLFASFNIDKIK